MDNVILGRGRPGRDEIIAAGVITPGDLVDPQAAVVHAGAQLNAEKVFADVNTFHEQAGKSIEQAYVSGESTPVLMCSGGERIYARLAVSQTIAAGDPLASAGNGQLTAVTTAAATADTARDSIVAYAAEAVTTTGAVLRIWINVA